MYHRLPIAVRKSEDELHVMSTHRMKSYLQSLQVKLAKAEPWCCEGDCFLEWKSDDNKNAWDREHAYVMFVKAVYKTRLSKGIVR